MPPSAQARGGESHHLPSHGICKINGRRVPTSADIEAANAAAAAANYERANAAAAAAAASAPSSAVLARIRARPAQLRAQDFLQRALVASPAFPAPPPPVGAGLGQTGDVSMTAPYPERSRLDEGVDVGSSGGLRRRCGAAAASLPCIRRPCPLCATAVSMPKRRPVRHACHSEPRGSR